MQIGISFISCSLVYLILLCVVYFRKKRIDTLETRIYDKLLVLNVIGLVLEIVCCFTVVNIDIIPILNAICNRLFLTYYVTFVSLFTIYIYIVCYRGGEIKNEYTLDKERPRMGLCILYFILVAFVLLLPLKYYNDGNAVYSYGPAVNFLTLLCGICMIFDFVCIFRRFKNIEVKKVIPLFVLLICFIFAFIIRNLNPGIILITCSFSFVTAIMYFTIENPDMKLINELNIARDQAEKANNAKTEFLSNMSHEIRTPLNAIVGFSQALSEEDIPASAKEEVRDIMMASENLLDIVNGILDISKIEANKLEIVNTEYSTKKIFDELISLTKARLGDKPLEFRINLDPSIPPYLYGDYVRLKQIVLNLLTNAVKYTKEGYLELKVSTVQKDNVCRLIVSVEDSGIGIAQEKIDKLFTKFERFDLEKNITIEGTGLGLAITKKLVELMNGKIVVQSVYGKGSRFTVAIDQRIVVRPTNPQLQPEVDISTEHKDFSNKKVLVVDDNKINLKVAARLLKEYQVQLTEVESGYECIEKVRSDEHFDLILLDDMMPKMSGVETLAQLRKDSSYSIPTVALTANAISGMKEKYLNDGFDDYLSKPIEKAELKRVIYQF